MTARPWPPGAPPLPEIWAHFVYALRDGAWDLLIVSTIEEVERYLAGNHRRAAPILRDLPMVVRCGDRIVLTNEPAQRLGIECDQPTT